VVAAVVHHGRPDGVQGFLQPGPARLTRLARPGAERDQPPLDAAVTLFIGADLGDRPA
jgi:hypothetical protein